MLLASAATMSIVTSAVAVPSCVLAVALTTPLTSMEVCWSDALNKSKLLRPLVAKVFSPSSAAIFNAASPSTLVASKAKFVLLSPIKLRDEPLLIASPMLFSPVAADC